MPDQPFASIEQQLFAASTGRMRVFGIRRCGQHAIINWILRNSGKADSVFLNSCTMKRSMLRTCGQSELDGAFSGNAYRLMRALESYLSQGKRPFVLVSYEAGYHEGDITPFFADQSFDHEVLVTRSFVNWLPSFMRLMRLMNTGANPEGLEISNGIIFEMMRYKAHLQAAEASAHVVVCFDTWAVSPDYRREKLAELGLEALDNGVGEVQRYGGGSSFSKFEQTADKLALVNRWETMAKDPYAKHFLRIAKRDSDFVELLAALYPADLPIMAQLLGTDA